MERGKEKEDEGRRERGEVVRRGEKEKTKGEGRERRRKRRTSMRKRIEE